MYTPESVNNWFFYCYQIQSVFFIYLQSIYCPFSWNCSPLRMGLLFSRSPHNLFVLESSLLRTYYESRLFLWVKRQCLGEFRALIWISANLCFLKCMENGLLFLRLRIADGLLIKGLVLLTSMRANLYL